MNKNFPEFSFAFQPIVDTLNETITSYEALVRGKNAESAWYTLQQTTSENIHCFDALLREHAIEMAANLGIKCNLNLNLIPGGLLASNDAISTTIDAAIQHGIALENITIEVTEGEAISDYRQFAASINQYRSSGIKFSIDDFGAGYSGLHLLAEFQPDDIKIDMSLVRDINSKGPKQAIIRGIARTCQDLGIGIIAEGVESTAEYHWLRDEGITIFQGYLFAKPGFEHLPTVKFPKEQISTKPRSASASANTTPQPYL